MTTIDMGRAPRQASFMNEFMGCAAALALIAASPVFAQTFDSTGSADQIIGSDVVVEDTDVASKVEAIVALIENTPETIENIRMVYAIDKIEVVFLRDLPMNETGPEALEQALTDNTDEILEMQKALEASAIFYNALDRQGVLLTNIVAVDMGEENDAIIYVRGQPGGGVASESAPAEDDVEEDAQAAPSADGGTADEPSAAQ